MAEYSWTIEIGAFRIGWIKYKYWNAFYEHYYRGYVRIGHLDFYNSSRDDGTTLKEEEES